MSIFDNLKLKKKDSKSKNNETIKCVIPLMPYQYERLASNCFNSLISHVREVNEAVKDTFEDTTPYEFEAIALMYSMAESFFKASGVSDDCRESLYTQVVSYCNRHFDTYVNLYSESEVTPEEVLNNRINVYDPFTATKRQPVLLWAPAEYEDDLSANFILMGNYLQYSVFSSSLFIGNPFKIPKSRLDAIEAFDFASVMVELNQIIGGYGVFVAECIKHEKSLL